MAMIRRFLADEHGMETVEWAVVAALLVLGLTALFSQLGGHVQDRISDLDAEISGGTAP